jgi:ankyrin repeat protein
MTAIKPTFHIALLFCITIAHTFAGNNNPTVQAEGSHQPAVKKELRSCALDDLFVAICEKDEPLLVSRLQEIQDSSIDLTLIVDKFNLSPLHWAASLNNFTMLKMLIEAGFSPNQLGGKKKLSTPLHCALRGNHASHDNTDSEALLEVIQYLVNKGKADVNVVNSDNQNAVALAKELKLADPIIAFLELHANSQTSVDLVSPN